MYQVQIYENDSNLNLISYLTVEKFNITIVKNQREVSKLNWKDILAINNKPQKKNKKVIEIQILLFIKRKKFFRSIRRYEQSVKFFVLPENVEPLKKEVRQLLSQSSIESPIILFMWNPIAGSNSRNHLDNAINFLNKTHFTYQIFETKGKQHCRQYLSSLKDQQKYWGIAIVSGDGLMHEYVNSNTKIPVTHIPGGSGNAIAKTQSERSGENCGDKENIYLAIKGRTKKYNLMEFQLENQKDKIYACLSLEWGIIADIDFESQKLRIFGGLRFDIYGLIRTLFLRRAMCKISYSETCNNLPKFQEQLDSKQFITLQKQFYSGMFCIIPYIAQRHRFAPLIDLDEPYVDMQLVPTETGRFNMLKYMALMEAGKQFDLEKKTIKSGLNFIHKNIKSFRIEPLGQNIRSMGLDGQEYKGQKMQARMSDKVLNMFTLPLED